MEQQRDYTKRTPREKAYQAIDTERAYQDTKYGPIDKRHLSIAQWEEILKEQMVKLGRSTDATEALHIIRKLAGVCVACMEQNGMYPREPAVLTKG